MPSGGPPGDGKKTGYLLKPESEYRRCDEKLFDALRELLIDAEGNVIEANRRIDLIENLAIFPDGTTFYRIPICLKAAAVEKRREERRAWISNALNETSNADLVFLDPDNGVACASARPTASSKGPKYVFWDEISGHTERGQSVVIYHHLCRSGKHDEQVKALRCEFNKRISGFTTRALIFKRGTGRAYFIVMSPKHEKHLSARVQGFMASSWKEHFREIV